MHSTDTHVAMDQLSNLGPTFHSIQVRPDQLMDFETLAQMNTNAHQDINSAQHVRNLLSAYTCLQAWSCSSM